MTWKQYAVIPHSLLKEQITKALDVQVPQEGVSTKFVDGKASVEVFPDQSGQHLWLIHSTPDDEYASFFCADGSEVLKHFKIPASTPSGDCLRSWLRLHGWKPKNERSVTDAQDNTRTII